MGLKGDWKRLVTWLETRLETGLETYLEGAEKGAVRVLKGDKGLKGLTDGWKKQQVVKES